MQGLDLELTFPCMPCWISEPMYESHETPKVEEIVEHGVREISQIYEERVRIPLKRTRRIRTPADDRGSISGGI